MGWAAAIISLIVIGIVIYWFYNDVLCGIIASISYAALMIVTWVISKSFLLALIIGGFIFLIADIVIVVLLIKNGTEKIRTKSNGETNRPRAVNKDAHRAILRSGRIEVTMPISGYGNDYRIARFDSQDVYYYYKYLNKEEKIGSYKQKNDNEWVFYDKEGYECGLLFLEHGFIAISRMGIYHCEKNNYEKDPGSIYEAVYPNPEFKIMLRIRDINGSGFIEDYETDAQVATYTGNMAGAACAFCSLVAEFLDETKYAKFLHGWKFYQIKKNN